MRGQPFLRILLLAAAVACSASATAFAQSALVLRPDRVFDGETAHAGWVVVVDGQRIAAAGPAADVAIPPGARVVDLRGATLLPGLIDAHIHLFLHPYDETSWNEQVLHEPLAYRVARAVAHAGGTLRAGFTTVRDLGTEGAGYADQDLKRAIEEGIVDGPRLVIASRAIVATGAYGPRGYALEMPQGAEEATGPDQVARAARDQIGHGADWVKVYADYRTGPRGETRPTLTEEEIAAAVKAARDSGRPVAAHAASTAGILRAVGAGVETIEHGSEAGAEAFREMARRGVALCPTLAAVRRWRATRGGTAARPSRRGSPPSGPRSRPPGRRGS